MAFLCRCISSHRKFILVCVALFIFVLGRYTFYNNLKSIQDYQSSMNTNFDDTYKPDKDMKMNKKHRKRKQFVLHDKDIEQEQMNEYKLQLMGVDNLLKSNDLHLKDKPKQRRKRNTKPSPSQISKRCDVFRTDEVIEETFECVFLTVQPNPQICLHPLSEDVHVSGTISRTGTWEPHIMGKFHKKLYKDPNVGFIDIGANIGVYSLVAASNGHQVIAVEPHLPNVHRLVKSIQLNKLEDRITIVNNAISDEYSVMDLVADEGNLGGTYVKDNNIACRNVKCIGQIKSVLLDDLLEVVTFEKAVMKIDIEGHEHKALRYGRKLFDKVYISYIIMEWIKQKDHYDDPTQKPVVEEMLVFLQKEGYIPFNAQTGMKIDVRYWYSWPDDVVWKHDLVAFLN